MPVKELNKHTINDLVEITNKTDENPAMSNKRN